MKQVQITKTELIEKGKHYPNLNTVLMVEDFLKVFPKAKIILDPFMGSGTVAKVSKQMNRNYIGFEKEKSFVKLANKRIL